MIQMTFEELKADSDARSRAGIDEFKDVRDQISQLLPNGGTVLTVLANNRVALGLEGNEHMLGQNIKSIILREAELDRFSSSSITFDLIFVENISDYTFFKSLLNNRFFKKSHVPIIINNLYAQGEGRYSDSHVLTHNVYGIHVLNILSRDLGRSGSIVECKNSGFNHCDDDPERDDGILQHGSMWVKRRCLGLINKN
jgi:hypothetical protein